MGVMIRRVAETFHPAAQPWSTRAAYRRELVTSATFPVAVAMLEGGVAGVLAKTIFDVSNSGFAMISAAPARRPPVRVAIANARDASERMDDFDRLLYAAFGGITRSHETRLLTYCPSFVADCYMRRFAGALGLW